MIQSRLAPATKDRRDWVYTAPTSALPPTLGRAAKYLKDQGTTNECGGHAVASAIGWQTNKDMSADWQYAQIEEIIGKVNTKGVDPRSAMKSGLIYGALPQELAPFTWQQKGEAYISDWRNWPATLKEIAKQNVRAGYFKVTGDRDPYDNIKQVLYNEFPNNTVVNAFSRWYTEFNTPQNGIIPYPINFYAYHAYIFIDWKTINGTEYLVAQLSSGPTFGDKGLLYFSREIVNRLFHDPDASLYIYKVPNPQDIQSLMLQKLTLLELLVELYRKLLLRITT